MAKMLVELEDLRGGKDTITLNIVMRPNRAESFHHRHRDGNHQQV
jgi:hypothetical protein